MGKTNKSNHNNDVLSKQRHFNFCVISFVNCLHLIRLIDFNRFERRLKKFSENFYETTVKVKKTPKPRVRQRHIYTPGKMSRPGKMECNGIWTARMLANRVVAIKIASTVFLKEFLFTLGSVGLLLF
jgi:hypothetical protein